jgi:WS/DGAT/MGAT family acyltransferase
MAARRSLNALDLTFLAGESREMMMHVGALLTFSPPKEGRIDFHRHLRDELRSGLAVHPPWNLKLRHPDLLASPLQAWVEDEAFDVEYHVRRSALPSPGDERELGVLVSRLHSHPIDFHRPPWEVHFIEGLEGGRIGIYFKVAHALVDGFTGMRLLVRGLTTDPDERDTPLFFTRPPPAKEPRSEDATFASILRLAREQAGAAKDVGRALMNVVRAARKKDRDLVSPLQAPRTIINGSISRNRRFATQSFEVERLRRVAKKGHGTINDVALAICSSGLRRLLLEQDALPDETMTAMLPVNVRPKGDPGGGNAVGAVLASLATNAEDPVERWDAIVASTKRAKEQLQGMSKNAIMQYSALLIAPLLLSLVPGAAGRVRPAFNIVVSNVPGPETPLYFRGWRMEAAYPLSIPFPGHALNVTVSSYAGTLGFGYTGCRDALPHLQRLAVYGREGLEELERALQM